MPCKFFMGLPFGGGRCENPIVNLTGNPAHVDTAQAATENVASQGA